MVELLFYFIIYSFGGWLLENTYNVIRSKPFFKPNFLVGPFKPMYGFASVLLVILIQPGMNLFTILFLCFFVPLIVEYVSGVLLEKVFHKRYWDYRDLPLQLHGHISLFYAVCWVFLSYGIITYIHPFIQSLYWTLEIDWHLIYPLYVLYFAIDFIWTVRKHLYRKRWVIE